MTRNPERVMVDCLDRVYELLCDGFGPVKTDQMIARSVSQAEQLPEADLFPPRGLLQKYHVYHCGGSGSNGLSSATNIFRHDPASVFWSTPSTPCRAARDP